MAIILHIQWEGGASQTSPSAGSTPRSPGIFQPRIGNPKCTSQQAHEIHGVSITLSNQNIQRQSRRKAPHLAEQ